MRIVFSVMLTLLVFTAGMAKGEDLTMPMSSKLVQCVDHEMNAPVPSALRPNEGQWIIEYSWSVKEQSGKPRYIISIAGQRNLLYIKAYWPPDGDLAKESMDASLGGRNAKLKSMLVKVADKKIVNRLFDLLSGKPPYNCANTDTDERFASGEVAIVARVGAVRWLFKGSILNLSKPLREILESRLLLDAIGVD